MKRVRDVISASAFFAGFSSSGRIDPTPAAKPHPIAIRQRDLEGIRLSASGPFSIVLTGGRFDSFRPMATEASGWIRTASGRVAVNA